MKCYLVGGAVRDELLGRPVKERDWVVVGGTPEELLAQGFRQAGKDFPVFLHPRSKEQYALARRESKKGLGHKGFRFESDKNISLEEDLRRRDLTINAMVRDEDGSLIDPYGGQQDLERRLLRHVSDAFMEDPLRVLRVARFAARYAYLGFRIAETTQDMLCRTVATGELQELSADRIWGEIRNALGEQTPDVFFRVLRQCGALEQLLPELERLFGVPQPERYHPEIDTGEHTLMVLQQAVGLSTAPEVRFAALVHDLGKGLTPPEEWPSHVFHEERGVTLVKELCERLHIPNRYRDLAVLVCRYHGLCHRCQELRPKTVLKLLHGLDVARRSERFEEFLLACQADSRGRTGFERRAYPQAEYLRAMAEAYRSAPEQVLRQPQEAQDRSQIPERIERSRHEAITALRKQLAPHAAD